MTISNDLKLLLEQVRYEVRYVDYDKDQFTVPVILTHDRAIKLITDNSISEVRFTPILGSSHSFTFHREHLIYEHSDIKE